MEWVTKTANNWGYNYGQYLGTGTLTYPNGVRSISTGDLKSLPVTYTAAASTEPTNMTYSVQNTAPLTYQPNLDEMAKLKDAFCRHKDEKKETK